MNKSDSIANLAKSLAIAQGQMGGAVKGKANPFFKSVYADLSSVVDAIREPLSANGLSFVQVTHPSERNEVIIETVLMHESGEWLSGTLAMPVSKADAQGYGSAITYAKRYGLQGLLGVPSEDDDGNAAAKAKPKAENKATPIAAATADIPVNPEDEAYLQELAGSLVQDVEIDGKISLAFDKMEDAKLDSDQKLLLWKLLAPNSKTRTALKKEGDQRRAAHQEAVGAGQREKAAA